MHLFLVINFRVLTSYKRNSSEEFARVEADAFHVKPEDGYVNHESVAEQNFIKPLTQIHAKFCCAVVVISEFRCRTMYVSPRTDD